MRATDLVFSSVYLFVLLVAFTQISSLSEFGAGVNSARFYPQLVLGVGLLVGVIETGRVLMTEVVDNQPGFAAIWTEAFQARRMLLLALFVVYLLAIKPVGFLLSTCLFCWITTVLISPVRSAKIMFAAVLVSVATLTLIYSLLVVYLQAFLP